MTLLEKINTELPNDRPLPSTGILLMGTNPLPIYAVIKCLQPDKVILLGTKDVESYTASMEQTIKNDGETAVEIVTTHSARAHEIRRTINSILIKNEHCWLSYTGGTKAMAVHAYEKWRELTGHDTWGIYLSSKGPTLHFTGIQKEFLIAPSAQNYETPKANFYTVADLHLFKRKNEGNKRKNEGNSYKNRDATIMAKRIHDYVLKNGIREYLQLLPPCHLDYKDPSLQSYSYRANCLKIKTGELCFLHANNYKDIQFGVQTLASWDMSSFNSSLGYPFETLDALIISLNPQFEDYSKPADRKKARVEWMKWLATQWLECWVATMISTLELFDEVWESVYLSIPKAQHPTEVDVCAMRGLTPYVFSCTVDDLGHYSKSKLFEVRQRASQIGGEHTRAAVICLTPGKDKVNKQQADLNQGWDGYGTVKVFGMPQIATADTFKEELVNWIKTLEE